MRLIPQSSVRSAIVILSNGFFFKSSFKDASSASLVVFDISFSHLFLFCCLQNLFYHARRIRKEPWDFFHKDFIDYLLFFAVDSRSMTIGNAFVHPRSMPTHRSNSRMTFAFTSRTRLASNFSTFLSYVTNPLISSSISLVCV